MEQVSMNSDDMEYDQLVSATQESLARPGLLFTTDVEGLFQVYLDHLPEENRQYHTCHACRRFFEQYGGLVRIDENGRTEPAVWSVESPGYYVTAIEAVAQTVRRARVTGVFLSSDATWGTPFSQKNEKHGGVGIWTHYHAEQNPSRIYRSAVRSAFEAMAEKRQDRAQVSRALGEFGTDLLRKAVKILESDALYRSEKVLGAAQWLLELSAARDSAKGKDARENVVWKAIAEAPSGFCHPRSSMIGTLLEDLASGRSVESCAAAFATKMHPLRYQRPLAAPTAGAIKQAEELFEKLGLAPSLERRYARLEEVDAFWRPEEKKAPESSGSVFGHLQPKGRGAPSSIELPSTTMTWVKFEAEVLRSVRSIELYAPALGSFCALVTAVHPDAPPLFQWDREERRNPASIYLYHGGSPPSRWGLAVGWTPVTALCLRPPFWYGGDYAHHNSGGVIFILDGARDQSCNELALFPETLRSELHGVRSVIEAHSKSAKIQGAEEASACGYLGDGQNWGIRLRVTDCDGDRREYRIDRRD